MNVPPEDLEPSLVTRASLLLRLRNLDDSVSWAEFHHLYFKLVYSHCRRSGLNHGEAEEVAQDVFHGVAQSIANFAPQPTRGSFRRWLLNLTLWRVLDYRRQDDVMAPKVRARLPELENAGPSMIETLPDPSIVEEENWEIDWQTAVLEMALARLAKKVPAKKFQAFELFTRRNWTAGEIAQALGMSAANVHLITFRMTRRLKKEVARLTDKIG
jgi:RNA polymerase sigma-70 factor (ECF subfamily)